MEEKIYLKMDVWAVPDEKADDGFSLKLCPPEKSFWMNEEDVKLGTQSVSFYPPDDLSHEELCRKAIRTMRDRQKHIQANAQRRVNELEEKIQSLLMLSHQPDNDNVIDVGASNV